MSKIEVNAIEPQSGTTLTIGASGDTVTLAAGASQSGFGRSGSVNWDTTPKTTTPVTAVSGNGYFINTTSIAITVNLPSTPAAGDIVAIADYANTSATNNITVGRNGFKIDGEAIDAKIKINGQVYTLVYVDATEGWKTVGQTFNQISTAEFVAATGGTITTCGNYKIHTFTGPGTFTVTNAGNPIGSNSVDYLVVAGGAAGSGKNNGGGVGGGGAGGIRIGTVCQPSPLSPAPLIAPGFTVSATAYPIAVGGGGACSTTIPSGTAGTSGASSSFSTFTAAGGGGGNSATASGASGGSGGGGGETGGIGGAGNTPPVSPSQGNSGGTGNSPSIGAGGGGFTAVGENSTPSATSPTGAGGAGINAGPIFGTVNGSPAGYFGGGGGASSGNPPAPAKAGGLGGGGRGNGLGQSSQSGTTNTGGGGGGHGSTGSPAGGTNAGGSGIVIIRYKFQ